MAPLNRCKELWQLNPTGGPGREGTGDNVCQQTLTGLYHNEVSVLEELRGWPANRPPQKAHIPTGQGSGLCVCVCAYLWAGALSVCLYSGSEKNAILLSFFFFFPLPLTSAPVPLRSPHRRLTLYAVTCDKPDRKAVFAVITVMTICLPLSKLCDKSQTKSNIWRGGSRRGEGNCVCVCFLNVCVGGSLSAAGGEGESLLLKDRPGN